MKKEIIKVNHEMFGSIRVAMIEGDPWFCLRDACKALGLSSPAKVKQRLNSEGVNSIHTLVGNQRVTMQEMTFIDQGNLYRCIAQSRKAEAVEFQNWVFDEVLPQIAKTGGYIPRKDADGRLYSEEEMKAIAQEVAENTLKIHAKELAQMKQQLIEQAPKVNFANAVEISDDTFYIGEVAQMITQHGCRMGRTRLFYFLRNHGYMFRNNRQPVQKWVERGYFRVCVRTYCDAYGRHRVNACTKITTLGAEYFINLFTKDKLAA